MITLEINMVIIQDCFSLSTDSLISETKTEDVFDDFSENNEMFNFSKNSTKSIYFYDSNKLVVDKIKDETTDGVTNNFLEPFFFLFLKKILIFFTCFFLKLFFVFLITFIYHFYL